MSKFYQFSYEHREVEVLRLMDPSLSEQGGQTYHPGAYGHIPSHIPVKSVERTRFIRRVKVTLELYKIDLLQLEEITTSEHRNGDFNLMMLYRGSQVVFKNVPKDEAEKLEQAWMAWKNANPDGWRLDTADGLWEDL